MSQQASKICVHDWVAASLSTGQTFVQCLKCGLSDSYPPIKLQSQLEECSDTASQHGESQPDNNSESSDV